MIISLRLSPWQQRRIEMSICLVATKSFWLLSWPAGCAWPATASNLLSSVRKISVLATFIFARIR